MGAGIGLWVPSLALQAGSLPWAVVGLRDVHRVSAGRSTNCIYKVCVCVCLCREVRLQLTGLSSVFPPWGDLERPNSGHQAWQQVPLLSETFHRLRHQYF